MIPRRLLTPVCGLLLLLPLRLEADAAPDMAPDEPPLHQLTIRTLSIGTGDFAGIHLQTGPDADPVELDFNPHRRSAPVQYEGPLPLIFFRKGPPPEPDAPPARIPVAVYPEREADVPEELLLFFLPRAEADPDTGTLFQVFGMDDSLEAFPRNTLVVFNATGIPLVGKIHEDAFRSRPGASRPFALRRTLYTGFAVETEEGPRIVFENNLEFAPDMRVILMLRPPRRPRSIRFQSYNIIERLDRPPPDPPPEAEDGADEETNAGE